MSDSPGFSLIVGFSSDMGNAEDAAMSFAEAVAAAEEIGVVTEAVELNQIPLTDLQSATHFVVVTSTFGDGEFPDNGALFWEAISADGVDRLDHLHFAVLALGDISYDLFCNAGKILDERLEALGGTRLAERIDIDGFYEKPAAAWTADVVKAISAVTSVSPSVPAVDAENLPPRHEKLSWPRDNPYTARLVVNRPLTAAESDKDVRHYEIDLGDSGMTYQAGDSVAVHPVNDPDLVAAVLATLGVGADHTVADHEHPLGVLLSEHLEIRTPSRALRALATAGIGTQFDESDSHDVLDLLEMIRPSVDELLDTLRPLQFRDYSIASSPLLHPDRIHLTVSTVSYTARNRRRGGVASTFLAHRGDAVRVHLRPNHSFRLPGPDVPVIMVGPGTGIAPFRAFLQERRAVGASGRSWLFFGDRRRSTDFLYGEELLAFRDAGVLSRLDLAFSRDSPDGAKDYVQHHMLANADEVFDWLQDGAHLYVCGDADNMAKDVHQALHQIVATAGGMTGDAAHAYVNELIKDHRYLRDVY